MAEYFRYEAYTWTAKFGWRIVKSFILWLWWWNNNNYIYDTKDFEERFRQFTGAGYCLGVSSGTAALHLALRAIGIKPGDKVATVSHTFRATAAAIKYVGAEPVYVDIEQLSYCMAPYDLGNTLENNPDIKAVIYVHLYGNTGMVDVIADMCKKKGVKLIEDCSQAHGTRRMNKHVGTFGDIGTFSFFPGKNLGAFGDAGAIITNSKKIYNKSLRLRNHGAKLKYDHKFSGRNSRLDTIQAAVLNIKLKNYNSVVTKRNKLADLYFKNLSKIKNIKLYQLEKKNVSCFHQFVIRVSTKNREQLRKFLQRKKIQTMIHYPYMLNELNFFPKTKNLTKSARLGKKIISLPISEEHSEKEIYFVIKKIKEFFKY